MWSDDSEAPRRFPDNIGIQARTSAVRFPGVLGLLCGAACAVYLVLQPVGDVVFWAALVCAVWLILLGLTTLHRPADLTEPIHWINAVYLVMFGLHPLFYYSMGGLQTPFHGRFDITPTYAKAISLGLASMLLTSVAYTVVARRRRPRSTPTLRERVAGPPSRAEATVRDLRELADATTIRRLRNLAWAMLFLGLLGLAKYLSDASSPTANTGSFGVGRTAYVYHLSYVLIPASLLFLVVHALGRRRADLVTGSLVSLVYAVTLAPQGSRTGLLLAVAAPAVFLAVQWKIRFPRLVVLLLVAVAVLAFSALRDANSPDATFSRAVADFVQNPELILQDTFTGNDTEMVDALALELRIVPPQIGQQPGIMVISTLGAPVPRLIWPAKPLTADVVLNQALFHKGVNQASVAYSMLGEAYFDSGVIGVFLCSIALGAVYGLLARLRDTRPGSPLRAALFAVAVALIPVVIRGILAYSLAIAGFAAGPLLLGAFLISRRGAHAERRASASGSS